jgi:hypothetical protein
MAGRNEVQRGDDPGLVQGTVTAFTRNNGEEPKKKTL